ncbi:hypothetical protein GW590_06705 [Rahnella sp. SAP-1]|uniref:Uncharacterized protein n=1 Tax=Rouxiella aceris TaxID=2703884 RepID=A0A848ME50_9GAMM|nr:hypothetical protein [Rouxiella aceris]NMP26558.1 hypothetical protein [Rouxiella aceris]
MRSPSSSTFTQYLALNAVNSVLANYRAGAHSTSSEPLNSQILQQLHHKMAQGNEWWQDASFKRLLNDALLNKAFSNALLQASGLSLPHETEHLTQEQANKLKQFVAGMVTSATVTIVEVENAAERNMVEPVTQALQDVLKQGGRQLALDILLETVLKLTGIDKSTAETFTPIITLIRNTRAALYSDDGSFTDRLKALTTALNSARNLLQLVNPGSLALRTADILCDVADVLHQGLSADTLKALSVKLEGIPGLPSACNALASLTEMARLLQLWNCHEISDRDLADQLAEKVLPQQVALPLRIAEKIALAAQEGKLQVAGVAAWPGKENKAACLLWLKAVLLNESVRSTLAGADKNWLMATLNFDGEEAECMQANLLQHAKTLVRLFDSGSVTERLATFIQLLQTFKLYDRVNINLNDNLGTLGNYLKDGTMLADLLSLLTATGNTSKAREALKLVDVSKTVKKVGAQVLRKTYGVVADAASVTALAVKKGHAFWKSPYSAGQSIHDPVRFYRDVITFFREDIKTHPRDYENATIETMLAAVAVAIKSLGGNHVPIKGNTAEWLKAYAQADQAKLTAVDKVLIHAVLEPRVMLEINSAIQQEDSVQARKLLEPLSEALKMYAGDSVTLREMAKILPYIPALCEAWQEIRVENLHERQALRDELRDQLKQQDDILRNSHSVVSLETQQARQKKVAVLQDTLVALQKKAGVEVVRSELLQAELDAMRATLLASGLSDNARECLEGDLTSAQVALDTLKLADALKGLSDEEQRQLHRVQEQFHQAVRESMVAEGVPLAAVMRTSLESISKILDALPIELKLTDVRSLQHFAAEVLARLATSEKPSLVSARAELAALVRNATSDNLADVVRWSANQLKELFTREVVLTAREKAQGWFVVERDISAGQLATGAAAGALLPVLFLLLSGEGLPNLKESGDMMRPLIQSSIATDENGESGPQVVRLSPSYAGIYEKTTEPLNSQGVEWQKWLKQALPVLFAAATGAGLSAAVNPAIREEPFAGDIAGDRQTRMARAGTMFRYTGKDGITRGINLTDDVVDTAWQNMLKRLGTKLQQGERYRVDLDNDIFREEVQRILDNPDKLLRKRRVAAALLKPANIPFDVSALEVRKETAKAIAEELPVIFKKHINDLIKFDPLNFVRDHIQQILNSFPDSEKGTLTSPDSLVPLRMPTAASGPVTKLVKLIDLYMGNVPDGYKTFLVAWDGYERWQPHATGRGENIVEHETHTSEAFRKAIIPNVSAKLSGRDSLPLKSQMALPDRILKKFNNEFEKTKDHSRERMSCVNGLLLKTRAKEIMDSNPPPTMNIKKLLSDFVAGKADAQVVAIRGVQLSDVAALRDGDDYIVWDQLGEWHQFSYTLEGARPDDQAQKFLVSKMNNNGQYSYREPGQRDRLFQRIIDNSQLNAASDAIGVGRKSSYKIPLELISVADKAKMLTTDNNLGSVITELSFRRMHDDMNSRLATNREFVNNYMIDRAFFLTGVALGPYMPGGVLMSNALGMTNSAGLTLLNDVTKYILSDSEEERNAIRSGMPKSILTDMVINASIGVSIPIMITKILKHDEVLNDLTQGGYIKEGVIGDVGASMGERGLKQFGKSKVTVQPDNTAVDNKEQQIGRDDRLRSVENDILRIISEMQSRDKRSLPEELVGKLREFLPEIDSFLQKYGELESENFADSFMERYGSATRIGAPPVRTSKVRKILLDRNYLITLYHNVKATNVKDLSGAIDFIKDILLRTAKDECLSLPATISDLIKSKVSGFERFLHRHANVDSKGTLFLSRNDIERIHNMAKAYLDDYFYGINGIIDFLTMLDESSDSHSEKTLPPVVIDALSKKGIPVTEILLRISNEKSVEVAASEQADRAKIAAEDIGCNQSMIRWFTETIDAEMQSRRVFTIQDAISLLNKIKNSRVAEQQGTLGLKLLPVALFHFINGTGAINMTEYMLEDGFRGLAEDIAKNTGRDLRAEHIMLKNHQFDFLVACLESVAPR